MRKTLRWGCAIALSVTLAGVALAHSEFVTGQADAVWNVSESRSKIEEAERQRSRLDTIAASVKRRVEIKEEMLQEYIEGRRSFADLVVEFEVLNGQTPSVTKLLRYSEPGANDTERTAHNVARRIEVRARVEAKPDLAKQAEADLAAFLEAPQS